MAEALVPDVEAVPPPRVLVGHSLGGAVAIELALGRQDLVGGLVLVAAGARLPVREDVDARAADDFAAACRGLVDAAFADPTSALARRALVALTETGPQALRADHAACAAFDARDRVGGMSQPVLVIAGADDVLVPASLSEELALLLPIAHSILVPRASHMLVVEAAGVVNLLVAAYLARLELTLADGA